MPFTRWTLSDLKASLVPRVDGSVFWDTSGDETRLAWNEALSLWNLLTGSWRSTITIALTVPYQVEWPLTVTLAPPGPLLTLTYSTRVLVADRDLPSDTNPTGFVHPGTPMVPTSLFELNYAQPQWRSESTASGGSIPTMPTMWAPQSLQTIVIWPAQATYDPARSLIVEGVARTPILEQDADTVDLADEWLDTLGDFTVHLLAFKEAGPRWRSSATFLQDFMEAAAEENGILKANQRFRTFAGLNRQRDLARARGIPNRVSQMAGEG